jgi:hypothetical protein
MLCSRISSLDYLQVPGTVNRESSNPEIYGWIFKKMQDSFILWLEQFISKFTKILMDCVLLAVVL